MTARRLVGAGGLLIVLATLVWYGWAQRDLYGPVDVGTRAPDFQARTLDGQTAALSDYRGRVVLLNLWATWCPPCIEEMPALQRLHDLLEPEGFSVVAVSLDAAPGAIGPLGRIGGDVPGFVNALGIDFPVLHDPDGLVERRFRATGLPTSYLIDRDGRIRQKVLGPRAWDAPEYVAAIREVIGA